MVGKGQKHAAAASSSAGDRMGTSIPASPLRRVLLSTMQGAPPVRGGRPPRSREALKVHVVFMLVFMLYSCCMHIGIYIHIITHVGIYVVLKVHVAAGEVGLHGLRHHPKLIHLSTGGLLGWIRLRWRLHGLRFTSLRSTSLRSTSLRPTRLVS